jgi:hypothetical protein
MQLTITKQHIHQHKICEFVNANYEGTSNLKIFAKFNKTNLEFGIDDIAPTGVVVYERSPMLPTEGYSQFIIIEKINEHQYRWTAISNNDSWKIGYFGKGNLTMSFGSKVSFSTLPKHVREKFVISKLFCQ